MDWQETCSLLGIDPLERGLQIVDAQEVAGDHFPRLDSDRPALIARLSSQELVRAVRETLLVNYPPSQAVTIVQGKKCKQGTLDTLGAEGRFTKATVLYLPPLAEPGSPQTLAATVARLRAPGGCPWDRKQTHQSLRRALLEETYEVIEALDEEDPAKLREELGDLLLHVLFQTQIARDQGEFTLAEVGEELAAKLIRRHPHVFGEVQVANADEVVSNWEKIKQEEKKVKSGGEPQTLESNIPQELPALARAQKIYERARRKGIRLDREKVTSFSKAIGRRPRERALGELLFTAAAWAEENRLDATSALRRATRRFVEHEERREKK